MNRQMTRLAAIVVGVSSLGSLFAPSPVKAENCVNAAAKGGGRGSLIGGVAGGAFGAGAGAAAGTSVGGPVGTVGGAVL